MTRTLVCAAASLLLVGILFAEDDKPKGDAGNENGSAVVKKEGKEGAPKGDPEAKADGGKKKGPDAGKKAAQEGVKKGDPGAKKERPDKVARKEGKKAEGGGQKGVLNKIGVEGGVVTLSVNGTDYEFPVANNTAAVVTTQERDGKQVVTAIYLVNAGDGTEKGGEKKAGPKNPGEQPIEMKYRKPQEETPK